MSKKHSLEAIATLVGMTIGAGILAIPFVVVKAGFLTGLLNIVILGIATLVINLYMGEISLRTKQSHQMTGYADIYLGKAGRKIMVLSMIFGMYGALIAYTIKEGEFLSKLLGPFLGGNPLIYSIAFFIIGSYLIYRGLAAIEKSELIMVGLILVIILIFIIVGYPSININNLISFDIKNIFIPYGVVLFAFMGVVAVPEMNEELQKNKKYLKKSIITGTLISMVIYIIFALIVIGITGQENMTDGAVIGLGKVLGNNVLLFGLFFGILTMATSFIAIGLALKEMYRFDFKLKEKLSTSLTCLIPLVASAIIILTKIDNSFFKVIDITGAISGGSIGILVVLMYWKAKEVGKRNPEYSINKNNIVGFLLILMFLAGIVYELFIITSSII
ncbi:MAG: aromatic amino acid transport family protein [Candidatus Woesearchaeota archaeon]|jgi:amino acid permease|nr:aromatic amino acid transport family protein [Candidatus Woesearchaeota archaeon]|tara:strand:+ start:147 stop:1313 length:1167 start_codon:yes stop_codon:yes gene_type:complete